MTLLISSLRIVLASLIICVLGYAGLILAIGQAVTPATANGSLITGADGHVVGSRLIAQPFTRADYFWPRPSAVDYDGAGAGGSNLAPTNSALAERAAPVLVALGASPEHPAPADLVTASGSGLDPHITEEAAKYQLARVAAARQLAPEQVEALIERLSFTPGGVLTGTPIVNVLELNLALDALGVEKQEPAS
ncbi:potassium-transporting ATPase subunit KdpC [Ruficoccus amylovorans]|uniref:Potassium-transporting ATPase KdpC subunit n=1 Tax=Ruficoccus amylovorans TaxID=1804625 RepID=A0A842HIW9_9BACT|nr:potassium-transporting ATPase subunit KdpC [Ruficoccus amylovorans]MBC2595457.1 potassium-transporting ATPase subunit KdpC [Ruficoccus amylovorans]